MAARTGDPAPGSRLFCAGDEVKTCRWDFISTHRSEFGVQRLCRVLGASRSGYYRHLATADARTERAAEEAATVAQIRRIHTEHRGGYGAPRIHAKLRELGVCINRKRVTRLMRSHCIVGRHLRRGRRTTIPDPQAATVPDLIGRDFTADELDSRWCGDITYIPVGSSWLYLATVIDICSRRVVGWSIAEHMRTELVTDALQMAVDSRGGGVDGVIFHSDHGAQYTSTAFSDFCAAHGIRQSRGRVGSSYDNALAESFFQSLKREWLHGRGPTSKARTRLELFEWLSGLTPSKWTRVVDYTADASVAM